MNEITKQLVELLAGNGNNEELKVKKIKITNLLLNLKEAREKYAQVLEEYERWAESAYFEGKPTPELIQQKVEAKEQDYFVTLQILHCYILEKEPTIL